jgi:hypothetical protein
MLEPNRRRVCFSGVDVSEPVHNNHISVMTDLRAHRSRVTSLSFSLFYPLFIASLGDAALGDGKGKALFSFLTAAMSVATVVMYLSFVSLMEYGDLKMKTLLIFAFLVALSHTCFIFCFRYVCVMIMM